MMFAGQWATGASLSVTVTLKLQLPSLFALSLDLQVTVVVPTAKGVPLAGEQVTAVGPSQLSFALAEKLTTAEHWPASLALIIGAGQLTTGASPSFTVTLKLHLSVLVGAS